MDKYTTTVGKQIAIEAHFKNCKGTYIGQHDFIAWLAQHDAEISNAERQRLAKTVWEEKQKVFDAITKDPTNSNLLSYQSGLYRALDIIEGVVEVSNE